MSATRAAEKSKHTTDEHAPLRKQLIDLLHGGEAHATFDDIVKYFPADLRGTVPANLPSSPSATSSTSPRPPPAATTPCAGRKTTGRNPPSHPPTKPGTAPSKS